MVKLSKLSSRRGPTYLRLLSPINSSFGYVELEIQAYSNPTSNRRNLSSSPTTQPAFTCSKLTIEK